MEWIAHSNSKENAHCKLCKCVISLSNMGEKALRSRAEGKKLKRLEDHEQVKNFFKPKTATDITKQPNQTSGPVIITAPVESPACFQDSACQKTEIMWALKHACNGLSDNIAKNVVDLFQTMFLNSKVAEKMQLEPNKLKYVVNHRIAPGHRHCLKLLKKLKK